jgi:hypothetical protein
VASNLPLSEWGGIIPDPWLVAAVVDRLTFNAHIIETGTESNRLRATKAKTDAEDRLILNNLVPPSEPRCCPSRPVPPDSVQ